MSVIDLYIDVEQLQPVRGFTDSTRVALPRFNQEDSLTFRVRLLKPNPASVLDAPYIFIDNSGLTLEMALGTRVGNTTTYYTQQFSWTLSSNPGDPYFEGTLDLNTNAIATGLGSGSELSAWWEIKYVSSGVPTTVLQQSVQIHASVIKSGGMTTPISPTPLSAEVAAATYVAKSGLQGILYLISSDGLKKIALYCDTDGTFHADPVT